MRLKSLLPLTLILSTLWNPGWGQTQSPPAPTNLSYSYNVATYTVNVPIANDAPTVTGIVTKYTVTPLLPAGLKIDSVAGIISGIPVTPTPIPGTNYTITAANTSGSTTARLSITVVTPSSLSYSVNHVQYVVGKLITPDSPTVIGTVTSFSVSPALPPGLTLNYFSGIISGTPTAPAATANYTITLTNGLAQYITATLVITVVSEDKIISQSSASRLFTLGITASSAVAFSLSGNAQSGKLEIFDMRGVKILENKVEFGDGNGFILWNGISNGHSISRGLYFVRLTMMDEGQNRISTSVQRMVYSP